MKSLKNTMKRRLFYCAFMKALSRFYARLVNTIQSYFCCIFSMSEIILFVSSFSLCLFLTLAVSISPISLFFLARFLCLLLSSTFIKFHCLFFLSLFNLFLILVICFLSLLSSFSRYLIFLLLLFQFPYFLILTSIFFFSLFPVHLFLTKQKVEVTMGAFEISAFKKLPEFRTCFFPLLALPFLIFCNRNLAPMSPYLAISLVGIGLSVLLSIFLKNHAHHSTQTYSRRTCARMPTICHFVIMTYFEPKN